MVNSPSASCTVGLRLRHFGSHAQQAGELSSYSILQSDFLTSDGPTGEAVEATAEAVLTDYPESIPGQQHRVT